MRAKVTKSFRFESAHSLPNHDGKCREPHGHSYRAVILCQGVINSTPGDPKEGMVIDFADIKRVWKEVIEPKVDHKDLNQTLPVEVTTVENIATWILATLCANLIPAAQVELWETETSSAIVTQGDLFNGNVSFD